MSIQVGQFGVLFRYSTNGLDMSASLGLELRFTKPDNTTLTVNESSTNPVSAPAVALVNDPDLGNQAASTYMQFTTLVTDFDQAGQWTVCGFYTDSSRGLPGTDATFTVLEACD